MDKNIGDEFSMANEPMSIKRNGIYLNYIMWSDKKSKLEKDRTKYKKSGKKTAITKSETGTGKTRYNLYVSK